jgi:hypothetical protein
MTPRAIGAVTPAIRSRAWAVLRRAAYPPVALPVDLLLLHVRHSGSKNEVDDGAGAP